MCGKYFKRKHMQIKHKFILVPGWRYQDSRHLLQNLKVSKNVMDFNNHAQRSTVYSTLLSGCRQPLSPKRSCKEFLQGKDKISERGQEGRQEEKRKREKISLMTQKKLAENSVPEISDYACNQGEDKFKTDKGLNIHIGRMHKEDCLQSTPEKERVAI